MSAPMSELDLPKGIKSMKAYYGDQDWCYFGGISEVAERFNKGKMVKLGMRDTKGRMRVLQFNKAGEWDARKADACEAKFISEEIDGQPTPSASRLKHSHRLSTMHRSSPGAQSAHKRARKPKGHQPAEAPDLEDAIYNRYERLDSNPRVLWFYPRQDNSQELKGGVPHKVAVMLSHGAIDMYDITAGQISSPRRPRQHEEDVVYQHFGYQLRRL